MAAPDEADLTQATAAVGTLLEGLGLSAPLYAVEPREGKWAVIVECATGSGWQRVELRAGHERLDALRETAPYGRGKVARYYLAETARQAITLPMSPELGRPEHDEWRWVSFDEAARLLPPRLQPILARARARLEA